MSYQGQISFQTRKDIDITKWDKCIDLAPNGLIYGYSFYLDHMSKNWDALVLSKGLPSENDYEAVMPLTWNKKLGIHYLYQPFLTAQLGVFGISLTENMVESFILTIPKRFKLIEISLNSGNAFSLPSDFSILRSNYELDLSKSYEEISRAYNENTRRNIKKAEQSGCYSQKDFAIDKVIGLAVKQMRSYTKDVKENIDRFRQVYDFLAGKEMSTTYGVFSSKKELLASCVFFFSHNRAYYILVGNDPNGKTVGASHALIDAFIKDHAGKDMVLDFEGSDIASLAQFYRSFGAVRLVYPAIRINKLPWYLKWLKN